MVYTSLNTVSFVHTDTHIYTFIIDLYISEYALYILRVDPIVLLTPWGRSSRRWVPLGALGYWLQFWSGWEEGELGILKGSRITSRAPSQTQSGRAGESGTWTGRRGPVVFWSEV